MRAQLGPPSRCSTDSRFTEEGLPAIVIETLSVGGCRSVRERCRFVAVPWDAPQQSIDGMEHMRGASK